MTKNFDMRQRSYENNNNFFDLKFNRRFFTDNYAERRGLEQYLYEDNQKPPLNINRPINPASKNIDTYIKAASDFLSKIGIKWP